MLHTEKLARMIVGTGCDIVEHDATQSLHWDSDILVQKKIFSQKELEHYKTNNNIRFLCGAFAVKEAVLKCLGTGMYDGLSLTDISISKSSCGKPVLELTGPVKKLSDGLSIKHWHISITHTSNLSMAFVIAES